MPKRALSSLFATAFAAAAVATSAGALAQTRTTDEQNAVIQSYVDTEEGCLIVDLIITSVTQSPPGGQVGFSSLAIHRAWANQDCATHLAEGGGLVLTIASGNSDQNPTEFTMDQRLRSGTLKTTMSVLFWALGVERPVVIDLVFSGIEGTLTPERSLDTFPGSANGPVIIHNRGYRRETTASGAVSDGTTEYFGNPFAVKGFLRVYHTQLSGPRPRMLH